jgi:hypothetical protein
MRHFAGDDVGLLVPQRRALQTPPARSRFSRIADQHKDAVGMKLAQRVERDVDEVEVGIGFNHAPDHPRRLIAKRAVYRMTDIARAP